MEFDFGRSAQSDRFFETHPNYLPFFTQLVTISNLIFDRVHVPASRLQDVGFDLGRTCREDYLDVVFLSVHGRVNAATKLLRGLYERALAIDHMINEPARAERFVRYAAIQEHRNMKAALRLVPEEMFDQAMAPKTSAAQIREYYALFKGEFESTVCKKCCKKQTQRSWDIDVTAMAQKVGEPYSTLFLLGYTIPTTNIHATLASAFDGTERGEPSEHDNITLIVATEIFLQVLRSQNALFSLGLDAKLESCAQKFCDIWPKFLSFTPEPPPIRE